MVDYSQKEYFLGSYKKHKPEHSVIYRIRPITATDFDGITTATNTMGDFGSYCGLYEICEKNYQSILLYHSTIKDDFLSNRNRSYEYMGEVSQEISRLLINYLSSFKTFYNHLNTRYTRLKDQG
jgi:hypothetical protein